MSVERTRICVCVRACVRAYGRTKHGFDPCSLWSIAKGIEKSTPILSIAIIVGYTVEFKHLWVCAEVYGLCVPLKHAKKQVICFQSVDGCFVGASHRFTAKKHSLLFY